MQKTEIKVVSLMVFSATDPKTVSPPKHTVTVQGWLHMCLLQLVWHKPPTLLQLLMTKHQRLHHQVSPFVPKQHRDGPLSVP